jgi:hypothetical protein
MLLCLHFLATGHKRERKEGEGYPGNPNQLACCWVLLLVPFDCPGLFLLFVPPFS